MESKKVAEQMLSYEEMSSILIRTQMKLIDEKITLLTEKVSAVSQRPPSVRPKSYAEVVQNSAPTTEFIKVKFQDTDAITVPSNSWVAEKRKAIVEKVVNDGGHVNNCRKIRGGIGLVVPSKGSKTVLESLSKISTARATITEKLNPEIVIYGALSQYDDPDIEKVKEEIERQNDVKILKCRRLGKMTNHLVCRVDPTTHEKLVWSACPKVFVRLLACNVATYKSRVLTCYKCCGPHAAANCQGNSLRCAFCSGPHESSGCTVREITNSHKCSRCNLGHAAVSTKCVILEKMNERLQEKFDSRTKGPRFP